jgi:hypothetical protein
MLTFVQPSPLLQAYVDGYVYVRDIVGAHRGLPIRTTPRPGGVLTVNLGRPNLTADGAATPMSSILGIQPCARSWRSDEDTHFVMALLTPAGLVRFAPDSGSKTAGGLVDLSSLIGTQAANGLCDAVYARSNELIAALTIGW